CGNTLEAVTGAWLLRSVRFQNRLERTSDVLALIALAAALSTVVSATIGVVSLCSGRLQPWSQFPALWWVWWVGDSLGALVIAALILTWAARPWGPWRPRQLVEASTLVVTLVLLTLAVFGGLFAPGSSIHHPLVYTVFPFVVWAALRFEQAGAAMVT